MRPLVRRIDRLQRLAVFEAAARCGGFSPAARELGISQPAVTRQIRGLERALDVDLFSRTTNRSSLTDAGTLLAEAIDRGFSVVEEALDDLSTASGLFVVAAPPGFAQQLIVPRLDELASLVPDCDIRLWLYDRDDELAGGRSDVAVRVGADEWDGFDTVDLFAEVIVPIATPTFAAEHDLSPTSDPARVLSSPLLHAEADGRPWASWDDWAVAFDLACEPGRRRVTLNNYPSVLQQVLAGRGIALGWRGIVDDLLTDGVVVEVGPEIATASRYAVSWPRRRRTPAVNALIAWLADLDGAVLDRGSTLAE